MWQWHTRANLYRMALPKNAALHDRHRSLDYLLSSKKLRLRKERRLRSFPDAGKC